MKIDELIQNLLDAQSALGEDAEVVIDVSGGPTGTVTPLVDVDGDFDETNPKVILCNYDSAERENQDLMKEVLLDEECDCNMIHRHARRHCPYDLMESRAE